MRSSGRVLSLVGVFSVGCGVRLTAADAGNDTSQHPIQPAHDGGLDGTSPSPEEDATSAPLDAGADDIVTSEDAGEQTDDTGPIDSGVVDTGMVDATPPPPDTAGCPDGQAMCPTTPFNSEPVSSYTCQAMINGACPAPDLIVVRDLLVNDGSGNTINISTDTFVDGAPEILEGCVFGAGQRRLLRFNFAAANVGTVNMNVGRPNEADTLHWEFFVPHHHFHIKGWGDYRLRAISDGREMGYGHKQSFCLEDNIRTSDMSGPRQFPPPLCESFDPNEPYSERPEFGLSIGWGDEYPANVRCQWIDLGDATPGSATYLPDGFYDLAVSVNMQRDGSHLYRENNYGNNTAHVRVQITGNNVQACDDHAGEACAGARVQCNGACG